MSACDGAGAGRGAMTTAERLAFREHDRLEGDSSLAALLRRCQGAPDTPYVVLRVEDFAYLLAERDALLAAEVPGVRAGMGEGRGA